MPTGEASDKLPPVRPSVLRKPVRPEACLRRSPSVRRRTRALPRLPRLAPCCAGPGFLCRQPSCGLQAAALEAGPDRGDAGRLPTCGAAPGVLLPPCVLTLARARSQTQRRAHGQLRGTCRPPFLARGQAPLATGRLPGRPLTREPVPALEAGMVSGDALAVPSSL